MKNYRHDKFIYNSYTITENSFEFHFSLGDDDYHFKPRWTFSGLPVDTNDAILHKMVFNLGMTELVSYWKAACPPLVEVRCGTLESWQAEWWKKLYKNGLGEFFYINGITPAKDFMTITSAELEQQPPATHSNRDLEMDCHHKSASSMLSR